MFCVYVKKNDDTSASASKIQYQLGYSVKDPNLDCTCVAAVVELPATASYGGGGSNGQKTSTPLIRAP